MTEKKIIRSPQYSSETPKVQVGGSDKVQIANYLLEEKIGAGGMGQIWRALDLRLARPVALKLLPNTFLLDNEARARFLREAKTATVLNHPNIVTIFDTGEYEQYLFIAMELIDGVTVRELIRDGSSRGEKAIDIAKQALMGLQAAHQGGIIHRDLKPENLMLRKDGYLKILDFGLAKFYASGDFQITPDSELMGTPTYMSPEQLKGEPMDGRSDLFSLGALLYEMASGVRPFTGENVPQIVSTIISTNPLPPAGVSPDLSRIIMKALQKDKEKRYSCAGELLADLDALSGKKEAISCNVSETSIVILPFACSQEDEILADGIVDEIIAHLSRLRRLRIIARSTSSMYRGQKMSLTEIGQALNVSLALEGSLRRSGERVRVTAQLAGTRDGFQIWNSRYEVKVRDIFDMEDEISSAIATELNRHFTSQDTMDSVASSPTIDSTVSELYFRGVSLQGTLRTEDVKKAIDDFSRVIELAPEFGIAHARLSMSLANLHRILLPDAPPHLLDSAESEAKRALELDPKNPDAYVSLGLVAKNRGDFSSAIDYLRQALKLSPNHVTALSWLAYVLIHAGNPEAGESLARKSIERDPAGVSHYLFLGYSLISQGRFIEAADALDRAIRIDPRNYFSYTLLLFANLAIGHTDDAKIMRDFLARSQNLPLQAQMALLLYKQIAESPGESPLDDETLRRITCEPEAERIAADIFALRGETDRALGLLESSVNKGLLNLSFIDNDPFLKSLRNTPGFWRLREYLEKNVNKYLKR